MWLTSCDFSEICLCPVFCPQSIEREASHMNRPPSTAFAKRHRSKLQWVRAVKSAWTANKLHNSIQRPPEEKEKRQRTNQRWRTTHRKQDREIAHQKMLSEILLRKLRAHLEAYLFDYCLMVFYVCLILQN